VQVLDVGPAQKADDHQASTPGERRQVTLEIAAAHDVENHVNALATGLPGDDVVERCFAVVDRFAAQGADLLAFRFAARGREG
nr:hypothetical protein [Tanacetum cinerariifolium]